MRGFAFALAGVLGAASLSAGADGASSCPAVGDFIKDIIHRDPASLIPEFETCDESILEYGLELLEESPIPMTGLETKFKALCSKNKVSIATLRKRKRNHPAPFSNLCSLYILYIREP